MSYSFSSSYQEASAPALSASAAVPLTTSFSVQSSGSQVARQSSTNAAAAAAFSFQNGASLESNSNNLATANQIASDLVQLNNSGRLSVGGVLAAHSAAAAGSALNLNSQAHFSTQHISGSASAAAASSTVFLSEIEQAILRSNVPVEINETEEITVLGQRGIWANKAEVINWKGVIPITQYVINEDANPEIITKRTEQRLEYIQELAIRYLRPPTPPPPGEIIIRQEVNSLTPPAPPLIIRQQPARPETPEPLVIREAPPQPPAQVCQKVITISGKRLPPPPRKVVIERLAPLPSKPQSVIVERWLPYSQVKRRVIYQRSNEREAIAVKPRNVIVQWEAPQVIVKKEVKYLGVIRANPVEYVQRYGATLKLARDLPQFVLDIKTPDGLVLAAEYQYSNVHELEGDLQAFKLVDLEREGLAEYRIQLQKLGINYVGAEAAANFALTGGSLSQFATTGASAISSGGSLSAISGAAGGISAFSSVRSNASLNLVSADSSNATSLIAEIFAEVDRDSNGRLSVEEAEKILLRLNTRLGRSYGEEEVRAFFAALDADQDGSISLEEFRAAFEKQF